MKGDEVLLDEVEKNIVYESHLQRNHTLFGSVWSSMRRKGGAPFSRRGIGVKTTSGVTDNTGGAAAGLDVALDPAYVSMQRGLSDGMNHIAQSIMNSGGRGGMSLGGGGPGDYGGGGGGGGVAGGLGLMDGDLVSSSTGELETPRRENIPLRPLILNGTSSAGGGGGGGLRPGLQ